MKQYDEGTFKIVLLIILLIVIEIILISKIEDPDWYNTKTQSEIPQDYANICTKDYGKYLSIEEGLCLRK